MKKNFIFYFLCFLTFVFFINSLFTSLKEGIRPVLFSPVYNTVNTIIEADTKNQDDILIKINGNYFIPSKTKNILNKSTKENIKSFEILVKEGTEDKIKNIVIFNDIKTNYFKDFSNFEYEKESICKADICTNYTKYKVPNGAKYNKNSDSFNFHSIQNAICVLILYCISGHIFFFVPYIFLILTIIYFINNKSLIKTPKINPYIFSSLIFLFLILIYSNGILDYLPWTDEYRTIEYCDPDKSIISIFEDPGNPPLFYFLFRCFITVFKISTLTMKIFPFLISIIAIVILWLFLKSRYNLLAANIGLFLASVNVPLIYYAQETRSYILQALLTPVLAYVLFKILEGNKKKYYIIYGILTAVVSNIHYYEILLLFSNFVFMGVIFISRKEYKKLLYFTLANATGALFFLPFFCFTAFNKALIDPNFNNWIPDINFAQITKCVFYLFSGLVSFVLSLIFFIKNLFQKKKDYLIIYSFFAIIFTIFQAIVLSYMIRPMLVERYLVLLSPLFIIFLTGVFVSPYKKKYMAVLFVIWLLFSQAGAFEKNNRRKGIIELPLSFSKQYFETKQKNENIYAIVNISNPEYLENKDDFMKDEIKYISRSILIVEETIDEILKKDKNATIFTSTLMPDSEIGRNSKNYKCFFNSTTDMCLWKITN